MSVPIQREVSLIDLGMMEYQAAWDFQTRLFNEIISIKMANRQVPKEQLRPTSNYLIVCEHPHVYTLGKSGAEGNLLVSGEELKALGATFVRINRGGDITYHGPGQIVVYPILDLENFFTDIHRYMRTLEEAVIRTLADYGISAGRIAGLTGVWLDIEDPVKARKICALGVKTSRWVTMHGLAFNVNTDLSFFEHIVPCGIHDKGVTSLQKEKGYAMSIDDVKQSLIHNLISVFEARLANSEETKVAL